MVTYNYIPCLFWADRVCGAEKDEEVINKFISAYYNHIHEKYGYYADNEMKDLLEAKEALLHND